MENNTRSLKETIADKARELGGNADFAIIHVWVKLPTRAAFNAFCTWNRDYACRPILATESWGTSYDVKLG